MEKDILEKLSLDSQILLSDIPDIDLYMDQVIQLFENRFKDAKRNDEEKILTKTMINNYAKSKLFFPIKNKKYSKEHLLLISLIYQLKGALSINDIKETLGGMNQMVMTDEDFALDAFYEGYLHLTEHNAGKFQQDLEVKVEDVKNEVEKIEAEHPEYLQKVLLICSLVHMSNMYRRVAENLVDEIIEGKKDKHE